MKTTNGEAAIVGFSDLLKRVPMQGSGRFVKLWALESWMMPHFAVNLGVVLQALGKKVDGRASLIKETTEKMAPPDYPFLRLTVEDVRAVVRMMNW